MSKLTPGPWSIDQYGHVYGGFEENGKPLAIIIDARHSEATFADKLLISAVHDLLASLEAVVAISDRKHEAWDAAKLAIAKAKGIAPSRL